MQLCCYRIHKITRRQTMYEQNKVSIIGRIIWLLISLLIIVGLVWFLLWLFVWRNGNDVKPIKTTQPNISTSQSTSGSSTTPATSTKSVAPSTNSQSANTASSTGETSSTYTNVPAGSLANTGPGNLIAPIALAFAGGTVYYHIRLRRKVQS